MVSQEERLQRPCAGDAENRRSEHQFSLKVRAAGWSLPAYHRLHIDIRKLRFIHEFESAVAIKDDEILINELVKPIILLDQAGHARVLLIIHQFNANLAVSEPVFLEQRPNRIEQ